MKEHIAAISVAMADSHTSAEVGALVSRLLALGVTKAEELLAEAENATNPESVTYDPEAKLDEQLRTLCSMSHVLEGVNDYKPGYSANTLYVLGTEDKGELVVRGSRSSFDAAHDFAIMDSALELSQAVELRNVSFAEHKVGGLLVRPATQGSRQLLMQKVLASLAAFGDIYTDAREKEGAVRAARNLGILAELLAGDSEILGVGTFCVNGEFFSLVDIRADGSFLVPGSETIGEGAYTLLAGGTYSVSRYVGECGDDETWVINNDEEFYSDYLSNLKL